MERPLAVIAGPTASGKSARAVAMARAEGGIVINADASQLYRDLCILSARPGAAEEAQAPHRLFGVLDAADACSAARWAAMAVAEVDAAHQGGRLPILVGGTGLYLRVLLDGIAEVPPIPAAVREEVRGMAPQAVRAALEAEDAGAAARLSPADRQRNARALEVVRATGRPLAYWQRERVGGIGGRVKLRPTLLLPDRDALGAAIDARFDAMMAAGALEEVRRLKARGLAADLPAMKALGVPPLLAHLAGDIGLDEAVARAKAETRAYAKRQATFFRTQFTEWTSCAC